MNYSNEAGFNLYIHYLALKRHFSSKSYDFFKYAGKVNASQASFEKRSDIYQFHKLSRMRNAKARILASMIHDENAWIGNIVEDQEIYHNWVRRNNSLLMTIESDISKYDMPLKDLFRSSNGDHPKILTEYIGGNVSPETLSAIDKACDIFKLWDKKVLDPIIYPDIVFKLRKYESFLNIDNKKVKELLKSMT